MAKSLKLSSGILLVIWMLLFTVPDAIASERADLLREALKDADRLVVEDVDLHGVADARPFELKDATKIAELVAGLDFDDAKSGFLCSCVGEFSVTFYHGEKGLASVGFHHDRSLRWTDRKKSWKGDSLFTPAAAKAWREWFAAQGEPRFENLHQEIAKKLNRQKVIHETFLAPFPPAAAAIFAEQRTGVVSVSPESEVDQAPDKLSPAAIKLLALFPDRSKFGMAAATALGSLCLLDSGEGSWSVSTSREQLVLECAKTLKTQEFVEALQSHNGTVLLGAARLFFFERLSETLPQEKRGPYAALLCEVVVRSDRSYNAHSAVRMLGRFPCDETTALLVRVASGDIVVGQQKQLSKSEPNLRVAACVLLARNGTDKTGELVKTLEELPDLDDMDRAALKVARALGGERGILDKSVFDVRSFIVGFGALKAFEKEGGRAALDAIVVGGTQHDWAAVREESVLAVERMTGKKWYQGKEQERAEWHAKDICAWWDKNRDTYPELPAGQ